MMMARFGNLADGFFNGERIGGGEKFDCAGGEFGPAFFATCLCLLLQVLSNHLSHFVDASSSSAALCLGCVGCSLSSPRDGKASSWHEAQGRSPLHTCPNTGSSSGDNDRR